MRFSLSHFVHVIFLSLLMAGCVQTPPRENFPDLRFSHLEPIRLNVNSIQIRNTFVSPRTTPNVEHLFPVKPSIAAVYWLEDRLKAVGGVDNLRATITKAGVTEVPLKRTEGLGRAFLVEQSERYDGEVEIILEIFAPDGTRRAMVTSRSTRTRTVSENSTLAQREEIWFKIVENMMKDLNTALEKQIQNHFQKWRSY
jgi:hypothetical protein